MPIPRQHADGQAPNTSVQQSESQRHASSAERSGLTNHHRGPRTSTHHILTGRYGAGHGVPRTSAHAGSARTARAAYDGPRSDDADGPRGNAAWIYVRCSPTSGAKDGDGLAAFVGGSGAYFESPELRLAGERRRRTSRQYLGSPSARGRRTNTVNSRTSSAMVRDSLFSGARWGPGTRTAGALSMRGASVGRVRDGLVTNWTDSSILLRRS